MKSSYRWYVAFVFFLFLLLHEADKLLTGPLTTAIMADRAPDAEWADVYTLRVRQVNDQWAWSSPIRVGESQERSAIA